MKKKKIIEIIVPIIMGVFLFFLAKLSWQGNGTWDKPFAIVMYISSAMGVFDGIYELINYLKSKR